ncbi:FAR1 DNA binding domain, zinc finger, SWIM-type, MULE transposase domain containing protein [Tanacetum coccineum]
MSNTSCEDDFEIVKVRDHVGFYVVSKDGTRTWYLDILPHGEKPIQGTQFVSIDQAYSFYVAYGKKAGFDVRRGGEYKVVDVEEIRLEKDMIFMKNSRNIGYTKQHFLYQVSNANFGPAISFRLMKQIHGGFDMVGVMVNDYKNKKNKIRDDDRLVGLFWADEEAIRNYATFGDIVSFDATFRSNKYQMVFVPFTRINHHKPLLINLLSGLLADETAGAYIWLLKQFKEAFGKDPKVVVTDQDPSMKIAIAECFPDTRHHLCMWHIMMKLGTKISPKIFEREWECMINEFELGENKWLGDMFDLRGSWIPAYLTDVHMAGLMHKMKEFPNQAEIDVPTVLKVSSKTVMSVMLGVDEPGNVLIRNLNLSKVKGMGCFSRVKPVAEVTTEELAKRRTCGLCGGKEGHNKRTCTNEPASKKPKVQADPKEKAAPKQQASQPRRSGLRSSTPK